MKVLIAFRGKYPNNSPGSQRISNYIKILESNHNTVDVISIYSPNKSLLLNYLISLLFPYRIFFRLIKTKGRYTSLLIYGFGWISVFTIILVSKLRGWRTILELNEKPYSMFGSRRDIVLKYINPLNHWCLKRIDFPLLDGFITISEKLSNYVDPFKRKDAIVYRIPIIVDFEYYQQIVETPDCAKPYMLHSAIPSDEKDGIVNVFKAFAELISIENIDLFFYLTSQEMLPKTREEIHDIIRRNNLENRVRFLGTLDESTLLKYQKYSSILVLNKTDSEQNRYNFATKLGEYLSLGIPVITTPVGEVKRFLENNVSCLFIDPANVDMLKNSIKELLKNDDLRIRIGRNGKLVAAREFDYKSHIGALNKFFDNVSRN